MKLEKPIDNRRSDTLMLRHVDFLSKFNLLNFIASWNGQLSKCETDFLSKNGYKNFARFGMLSYLQNSAHEFETNA